MYCEKKNKAKVNFRFNNGQQQVLTFNKVPIDIITTPGKGTCWRFSGIGVHNKDSYEDFACGNNPSFKFNGSGYNLFMDGVMLQGSSYEYRANSQSIAQVSSDNPTSGVINSGNCVNCLNTSCKIQILYNGQEIFSQSGDCPLNFNVACDDDCPSGYIKCDKTDYPNYCCIPCNEIKSGIADVKAILKNINNG